MRNFALTTELASYDAADEAQEAQGGQYIFEQQQQGKCPPPYLSPLGPLVGVSAEVVEEEQTHKKLCASYSEEFVCPITHGLMVDPVLAEDGNTYERIAILKWPTTTRAPPGT